MPKDRKVDYFKAIRILAAEAVKDKDPVYLERFIMRWYSKTFSTTLSQVEELPFEDILQHFFEEHYEKMDEEELDKAVVELLETDEERKERLMRDAADELAAQQLIKTSQMENAKLPSQQPKSVAPKGKMKGTDSKGSMIPETEEAPKIEMEFAAKEDFEKLISGLSSFADVLKKAKAENEKAEKGIPKPLK